MNVMDDCYPKEVEAIYRRIAEGMDLPRKRKRHLEAMNHTQLQAHNLKIALSVCCKEMNLDDAVVLYNDAKSRGIHPSSDSYNNLLSLVAGLGEQGSGSYPIREVAPPSDINAAFVVFRDAKDQKIAFSEASYTALIRCCCANNRCQEALNLYEEMIAASLSPRLRTFTPLLASFSLLCDVSTCRRLFDAMTITYSLIPTEREYLSMLRLFLATNDTTQFLSFLSIMAQDIFIPTRETWDVMEKWVQAQNAVTSNYVASHRVVSPTGYISPRGPQLASIDLTPDVRQTTLQQITEIVEQRKTKESAKWTSHITWLQNLAPNAFDVIIDGANVGYYQQNYEGAPKHVDYVQIDTVLRQLQLSGHRPLLILHCRHLFADVVPAQYAALVAAWKQEKVICITPAGFNDDWFWLYSALYLGCDVVTNDEMRDHHFQMLSTRWFSIWKERHQVKFAFGKALSREEVALQYGAAVRSPKDNANIEHETHDSTEKTHNAPVGTMSRRRHIDFFHPLPYSHRIQLNDAGYFFPSTTNSEELSMEWLCVFNRKNPESNVYIEE